MVNLLELADGSIRWCNRAFFFQNLSEKPGAKLRARSKLYALRRMNFTDLSNALFAQVHIILGILNIMKSA